MTTQQNGVPLTKYQLAMVQVLEKDFGDHCVDTSLLLDVNRYDPDQRKAALQFKKRLTVFDCYKGVFGVHGAPRVGKSGFIAAHTWHGREWFDRSVVTYGFGLTEVFGDHNRINHEAFLDELEKTTEIAERRGQESLSWTDDKGEIASGLFGVSLIIEEAHKVLAKDHRTRISMYIKDLIAEWGHYDIGIFLITHDLDLLDAKRVGKFITHEIEVTRNLKEEDTSDVSIYNRTTQQTKPVIEFHRQPYYPLWETKAPIAIRSNVSKKEVDRRERERDLRRAEAAA